MTKMKAVASWSGGKDSCLAYYRALSQGIEVTHMLNLVHADGERSMSHEISTELIAQQVAAIGIPVIQRQVTWDTYEQEFKKAITELKRDGIEAVVTGDIDLAEGRRWNEKMRAQLGVEFRSPLWGEEPGQILRDFIEAGFEAIVVVIKTGTISPDWIGRRVTMDLLGEETAHPCGELGEYHTLVLDGPVFTKRIEVKQSRPLSRDGYLFLDISEYRLIPKS
jgi:uncharacterized protein (TIGR00290 family)